MAGWTSSPARTGTRTRRGRSITSATCPYTNNYIDDFSDLPLDVNGDGKPDLVSVSWFGKKVAWWQNPGRDGTPWKETVLENNYNC